MGGLSLRPLLGPAASQSEARTPRPQPPRRSLRPLLGAAASQSLARTPRAGPRGFFLGTVFTKCGQDFPGWSPASLPRPLCPGRSPRLFSWTVFTKCGQGSPASAPPLCPAPVPAAFFLDSLHKVWPGLPGLVSAAFFLNRVSQSLARTPRPQPRPVPAAFFLRQSSQSLARTPRPQPRASPRGFFLEPASQSLARTPRASPRPRPCSLPCDQPIATNRLDRAAWDSA